jgi:hypothetical protein
MTIPANIERLPRLIERAKASLDRATTAAEVLDARREATIAVTAAEFASRLAKAAKAHETVKAAARKFKADAMEIENRADCRIADEYDAAQERGEIRTQESGRPKSVPNGNTYATLTDIGLTRKQVHQARQIRDAEKKKPGAIRKMLDEKVEAGEEPTRADVKRTVKSVINPDAKPRKQSKPKKESKPRSGPQPNRRKNEQSKENFAACLVLDQNYSYEKAAVEAGVGSIQIVKTAVPYEQGRRAGRMEADRSDLSATAQEKFDSAIRRYQEQIDVAAEVRIREECVKWIDNTGLPLWIKKLEQLEARLLRLRDRKGVFSAADFRKIKACLDPQSAGEDLKERLRPEAFILFNNMREVLVSRADAPTPQYEGPRTRAEAEALKRKNAEEDAAVRRAKKAS